jgi:hypothetical protein
VEVGGGVGGGGWGRGWMETREGWAARAGAQGGRRTKVRGLGVFSMKSEGFVSIFNEK